MAEMDLLYTALRNADAAGDVDAARKLAAHIKEVQAQPAPAAAMPAAQPFGQQLNHSIADAPRQLGLTARYGLEGLGGTFDSLIGNPLRTLAAPMLGNKPTADTGGTLANLLHLPMPQNAQERVVGDTARMAAGALVPMGVGSALAKTSTGVVQRLGRVLAANPAQQLASSGAAGAAGGYTRETGGDDGAQLLASLGAGIAAPAAMGTGQRLASAAARRLLPATTTPQQAIQIDLTINSALQHSGLNLGDLPQEVAAGIRKDVAAAFRTSDQVSPDAVRRLADYRLTGLTPTAAGLTLDPAIVTQQKNLAKLGINSKDRVAQQLGQTENANNRALTTGLNGFGAGAAGDQIAGAERIMSALTQRDDAARAAVGTLYESARDSTGRSAQLDHVTFANRAGDLLHDANVESFLTPDIRNKLNGFSSGQIPLNVEIAEQFKTAIERLRRNSTDGNTRHALGLVRQALEETPLTQQAAPTLPPGSNQIIPPGSLVPSQPGGNLGQDAIDAFNRARAAHRDWMQTVEGTPALQAIRDGVEPDRFVRDYIVGNGKGASVAGMRQLRDLIGHDPDAVQAVREQIAAHLKNQATSGAADETARFSQSSFKKALDAIGDRKLNLFFQPGEVAQMRALSRVASYEQFQPAGSAVNNSNTAGATAAILERIANSSMLSKIPILGVNVQPAAQNISLGIQAGNAMNVPRTLAVPGAAPTMSARLRTMGLGLSPAMLISMKANEDRQNSSAP